MTARAPEQLHLFHVEPIVFDSPLCVDCDVDTVALGEWYMVHDHVWPIGKQEGLLCIGCLEQRIGRRLTREDFNDAIVNCGPWGPRLEDRLGGRAPEGAVAAHERWRARWARATEEWRARWARATEEWS